MKSQLRVFIHGHGPATQKARMRINRNRTLSSLKDGEEKLQWFLAAHEMHDSVKPRTLGILLCPSFSSRSTSWFSSFFCPLSCKASSQNYMESFLPYMSSGSQHALHLRG